MVGCADTTRKVAGRTVGRRFGRVSDPFPMQQAHSCQAPCQTLADHPQVGQREQRVQLRRVLGQAAIAHLHMAELALDDTERMLHLARMLALMRSTCSVSASMESALSSSLRKPGRMATCHCTSLLASGRLWAPW